MKSIENNNAITLIALIITIIILVILAAVSINAVYNAGTVGYAINGTEKYVKEAKSENEVLDSAIAKLEDAVENIKEIQNNGSKDDNASEISVNLQKLRTYFKGKDYSIWGDDDSESRI